MVRRLLRDQPSQSPFVPGETELEEARTPPEVTQLTGAAL